MGLALSTGKRFEQAFPVRPIVLQFSSGEREMWMKFTLHAVAGRRFRCELLDVPGVVARHRED
jgi:hypothetical protein